MGMSGWDAQQFLYAPRKRGHFYAHPQDGPVRVISGNLPETVCGRTTDSGYYRYEMLDFLPEVEIKTAVLPPMNEIDAERYRDMLVARLEGHGLRTGNATDALKMSLALLPLDEIDAHVKFVADQDRAQWERRVRQQRYDAPLDDALPAVL